MLPAVSVATTKLAQEAFPATDFIQVYGLTEVCGVITHLLPDAHRDDAHPELQELGEIVPYLAESVPQVEPPASRVTNAIRDEA